MRISFHNLGCKVNSYETESMESLLFAEGFEIVPFEEPADVCVINTCSVTNIADRKSRQMIHKARKLNPEAIIVAAGCYAQMFKDDLEAEGCANIIIGNNKKGDIVRLIKEYRDTTLTDVSDLSKGCEYEDLWLTRTGDKTRAFIKIEDGCNNFCTYCIIPFARGRVRSRSIEDIVKEVKRVAAAGYKEIVLTGINLSSYGTEAEKNEPLTPSPRGQNEPLTPSPRVHLIDVLEAVSGVEGIERIRISSLEPVIITEEFLERLAKLPKVCPHFHLSLQSGCDSVLSRMNRHYTTAEYLEKCRLLREYFDHPAITTDVIVGFPGETVAEFETTRAFLKECAIYEAHVFKYSRRKGTKADRMPMQLTEKEKSARSSRLISEVAEGKKAFMEYYIGREVQALMEERITVEGKEYFTGLTPEYVRVAVFTGDEDLSNTLITGRVSDFLTPDCLLLSTKVLK